MDAILDFLRYLADQLIGRFSGPLNFRLVVMPTVVTLLALRADQRQQRQEPEPHALAAGEAGRPGLGFALRRAARTQPALPPAPAAARSSSPARRPRPRAAPVPAARDRPAAP